MFDVTDKRAVDRLAAVVVMLEGREAEAGRAYADAVALLLADDRESATMTEDDLVAEHVALCKASARYTEAQSALAAARELATDR